MKAAADRKHFHSSRFIGECAAIRNRFNQWKLRRFCERIGKDRKPPPREILEEGQVVLVRDDRQSFRYCRPHAGRMIEVMVRVDHCANRLAGTQASRFLDHRERPLVTLWCFNEQEMVLHLDSDAVV